MRDFLGRYAKGVRAFLGLVFLWAYASRKGGIDGDEWWGLAFIVAGTLGVVDATNTPEPEPWDPPEYGGDRGASELALGVLLGIVGTLAWLALFGPDRY